MISLENVLNKYLHKFHTENNCNKWNLKKKSYIFIELLRSIREWKKNIIVV